MSQVATPRASVEILTFKDGLLSTAGHDLKLSVARFDLAIAPDFSTADLAIRAPDIQVICAMRDGREDRDALTSARKNEIHENLERKVLETDKYPTIAFHATAISEEEIVGELRLHGANRIVRGKCATNANAVEATFTIDVRDFGMVPFKALLGTLKVKPAVLVRVMIPKSLSTASARTLDEGS